MPTSSFQRLRMATLSRPGKSRYRPSASSWFFFSVSHQFRFLTRFSDLHTQFKLQELLRYAMKLGEWRSCREAILPDPIRDKHTLPCHSFVTFSAFETALFFIGRLRSGSEQAADEWGVGPESGASSTPRDSVSSCSCPLHRREVSQHFPRMLICSH